MAVTHASNAVHPTPQKSECVETLTTPTFERALASQNEFHAFASMVLAGLPFPPLPVMVRQGADGEYAIASSFDLLQQTIVAQQVALQGGTNATSTAKSAAEVVEAKTAMLMRLQRDMAAHVQNARETTSDAFLERAYDICRFRHFFSKLVRFFLALYGFWPLLVATRRPAAPGGTAFTGTGKEIFIF